MILYQNETEMEKKACFLFYIQRPDEVIYKTRAPDSVALTQAKKSI